MADSTNDITDLPGIIGPELAIRLFEDSPDAIVLVGADGIVRKTNRQADLLFGYHHSEMEGQKIEILVPETLRDAHKKHRAKFADEGQAVRPMGVGLDLMARRKDSSLVPVEINLSRLVTREGEIVIATIRRKAVKLA